MAFPLWIVFLACSLTLWLGIGIGWLIHSMFEADKLREESEYV